MNERLDPEAVAEGVASSRKRALSPQEIVHGLAAELGVRHVTYYAFGIGGSPIPVVVGTYPDECVRVYQERGYFFIDPVIERAAKAGSPMSWDQMEGLDYGQRRFLDEWKSLVGQRGISIPFGHPPVVAALSITSDEPEESWNARKSSVCWSGMVAGQRIHRMVVEARVARDRQRVLSDVQAECLSYLAIGMDLAEIGAVLSLREGQVRRHLDEAQRRMNALSHSHAVAKATALGHIGR